VRYDLDAPSSRRSTALLDYLQRFVDEVAGTCRSRAGFRSRRATGAGAVCARANVGAAAARRRGEAAPRARAGPADWDGLHAWFVGRAGRDSDAAGVRRLDGAMRALLVGLRRIAAGVVRNRAATATS
jgi:hypothetical protein